MYTYVYELCRRNEDAVKHKKSRLSSQAQATMQSTEQRSSPLVEDESINVAVSPKRSRDSRRDETGTTKK